MIPDKQLPLKWTSQTTKRGLKQRKSLILQQILPKLVSSIHSFNLCSFYIISSSLLPPLQRGRTRRKQWGAIDFHSVPLGLLLASSPPPSELASLIGWKRGHRRKPRRKRLRLCDIPQPIRGRESGPGGGGRGFPNSVTFDSNSLKCAKNDAYTSCQL